MSINRTALSVLIFYILFTMGACSKSSATKNIRDNPPNIIYILADDLGYGDLSCYGQKILKTPNIDGLAAEGMKFTQHYAGATVCAPSRASLLTGKQPGRSSVRGNSPAGQLIQDNETTIPKMLKKKDYKSAVIGKWGVGNPPNPMDPIRNGFDEYFGYINMWHAHNFYPEFLYKNGKKVYLEGNVTDWSFDYSKIHKNGMPEGAGVAKEKETYVLGAFESATMDFIEKNQNHPFFIYLALNMPHANNEAGYFLQDGMEVPMFEKDGARVPNYGQFTSQPWPAPEKGFARMMELIDMLVGKISLKLQALDLAQNTVLIFSSDNGPHQEGAHRVDFFESNGPLRGKKRDLYEGGIRVPLIVRWPGKIKAGSISDHPSAFWDVLPTFCDIAGIEKPTDIDGISFLPTLLGNEKAQKSHPNLYWEFYEQGGRQAIREGKWKYVKLNVRDQTKPIIRELYDLEVDISESNNLIEDHPDVVNRLEQRMEELHLEHKLISLFSMETNAETAF